MAMSILRSKESDASFSQAAFATSGVCMMGVCMMVSPKILISAATEPRHPFNAVHSSVTWGNDATSNG